MTKKRDRFVASAAKAAMAGLLADPVPRPKLKRSGESCAEAVARIAVEHAKALKRELER